MQRASDLLLGVSIYAEPTKTKIIDFARSAMDELSKLGEAGEPLWQPHEEDVYETLNDIEYLRQFGEVDATLREIVKLVEVGEPQYLPRFGSSQRQDPTSNENLKDLQIEASRDTTYIKMVPINLVELLMDVNQWSRAFYDIVSKTTILTTLSDGMEGSYDRKLHVMSAEFHLPSPILPTRECYFARYCKKLSEDTWGVVDVSLEKFFPFPLNKFRKRPSGCLITRMLDESSKVTWVEHVEVDHSQISNLFKPLVTSGLAFGATRWLASLVRHIELCESLKATKLVTEVLIPQIGRTSFLKLADRLMRIFCANVSGTTCNPWMQLYVDLGWVDVRVMVENNMVATPNKPRGTLVVFTTTLFLNVSPNRLFHFLRHEKYRNEWDKLSRKLSVREFAHMIKGERPENRVSLLVASSSRGETQTFYLQESYTDSSVAYVIFTPLEVETLKNLIEGQNSDNVIAFPSGFSIIPGGLSRNGEGNDVGTGSILTIAFHLTAKDININFSDESLIAIYSSITETATLIKDAMEHHTRRNNWVKD